MNDGEYLVITQRKMSDKELQEWLNMMYVEKGWFLIAVHDYQYIFGRAVEK